MLKSASLTQRLIFPACENESSTEGLSSDSRVFIIFSCVCDIVSLVKRLPGHKILCTTFQPVFMTFIIDECVNKLPSRFWIYQSLSLLLHWTFDFLTAQLFLLLFLHPLHGSSLLCSFCNNQHLIFIHHISIEKHHDTKMKHLTPVPNMYCDTVPSTNISPWWEMALNFLRILTKNLALIENECKHSTVL